MRKDGFTLVEIMVGIAVFGAVIVGGFRVFAYGTGFIERASRRDIAVQIAGARMELLKDTDYSNIVSSTGTWTVGGVDYDFELVEAEQTVNNETFKEIDLTVNWEWNNGVEDLSLSTKIGER